MKRNLLLIASSLLLAQGVYAQQIGIEQARSRAHEFGLKNSARKGHARGQQTSESATPELVYTCHNESDQRTCFYIFNFGNDEGYVVVGGDEVAKEILGYSESGSFDWDTAPENEKWWLSQYKAEISAAMDLPEEERQRRSPRRGAAATAQERVDIPIMLTTMWNQGYPYNTKVNDEIQIWTNEKNPNYQTGCVATAAAQVMKYHQHPRSGVGEAYCRHANYELYANFSRSYYEWSLMKDDPIYNDNQGNYAIASLMYDIGVACDMKYGNWPYGSSTTTRMLGYALIENFRYDKGISECFRINYTDEAWESMLYNELIAGRPVLYGGSAHEFVCDGYRASDNAFHFNWGYGGSGNYYQISGTEIYFQYTENQHVLINVKPNSNGDYVPFLEQGIDPLSANDMYFKMSLANSGEKLMSYNYDYSKGSEYMNFEWPVYAATFSEEEFEIAIQATERSTGYKSYLRYIYGFYTMRKKKSSGYYLSLVRFNTDLNTLFYNGIYDLKPVSRFVSKTADKDWYDIALLPDIELPIITVTNAHTPDEVRELAFSLSNSTLSASRPAEITAPKDYNGKVNYSSSDVSVATVNSKGVITAVGAGSAIISVVGNDYYNGDIKCYNGTTQTFEVNVERELSSFYCDELLYYNHTEQIQFFSDNSDGFTFISDDPDIVKINPDGSLYGVSPGTTWINYDYEETELFYGAHGSFPITVYRGMAEFFEEPIIANDGNICEGEPIYLPLIDHGSLFNVAMVYFKDLESGGNNSYFFDMDPDVEYLQEIVLSDSYYAIDKTYTVGIYHDNLCTDPFNIPTLFFTIRKRMEYAYTVPESGYGTLLLPFCADVPDGWEVFACPELNAQGNTAMLERVATIARNKPYIIKAAPGSSHIFIGPKAIDATSPTFAQGELKGAVIADNMNLTTSDYVLDTRDGITAFYRYQAGDDASAYCDVFRAVIHPETTIADVIYLQLPGPWGDVNGDDRVSVGDVATLVGHLKGNTPQPFVKGNADADKNGQIDNQDVEAVRNLIIERVNP